MNERREKLKRVGLWVCGVVAVLALAFGALSTIRAYTVQNWHLSELGPAPDSSNLFELKSRVCRVTLFDHRLEISSSLFIASGASRDDLRQSWSPNFGWSAGVIDKQWRRPPSFAWNKGDYALFGIGATVGRYQDQINNLALFVPFWLIALVFGLPVLVALYRWRRERRRRASGQCVFCGYSRAALAPEIACPECGKVDHLSQQG